MLEETAFSASGTLSSFDKSADSGNVVTRFFCPTCGSGMYSKNSAMPGFIFPRASSLDDPEVAKPQIAVYASRAPSWDFVDPALPKIPEMPEGKIG